MTVKLHIDLAKGLIEAEGSEEFVLNIYNDFKNTFKFNVANPALPQIAPIIEADEVNAYKPSPKKPSNKKSSKGGKSYTINKSINLYEEGKVPSLVNFMKNYSVGNNMDRNVLFVYYLKELKKMAKIGPNEIYTCYKSLGIKVPNVDQGLRDCSHRKGWIDTSDMSDITITVSGDNAINHELIIKKDGK